MLLSSRKRWHLWEGPFPFCIANFEEEETILALGICIPILYERLEKGVQAN